MSATSPNLMNIPNGNDIIRKAFIVPSEDYTYILADYSQVEIRLTAHCSRDPLLLDAILTGQDVHTRTMCEMFGYDYDFANAVISKDDKTHPQFKILTQLRKAAKIINFGVIYGVTGKGLSEQIPRPEQYKDLSTEEWIAQCEEFQQTYLRTYNGIKKWMNKTKRLVKAEEIIYNAFGRPRHLPHANAYAKTKDWTKKWMEESAGRQGPNFEIQGLAGDVFKIAIVRIHRLLKGTNSRLVNFVHDEVQIYLHKQDRHLLPSIKKAMKDFDFAVPLEVDFSESTINWAEKNKITV